MSETRCFDEPIPEVHLRALELSAAACKTHHRACACQEWGWVRERERLEAAVQQERATAMGERDSRIAAEEARAWAEGEVERVSKQIVHLVGAGQRLNRAAMLFLIEQYHEEETDATISSYAAAVLELGDAQSAWRAALAGRAESTPNG